MGNSKDASGQSIDPLHVEIDTLRRSVPDADVEIGRLAKRADLFKFAFDQLPFMVSLVSADGRIEIANRAWEQILGWPIEELTTWNFDVLLAKLFSDSRELERFHRLIREGHPAGAEFAVRTRDGHTIQTTWTNVSLADGAWLSIGQHVPDRSRTEPSPQHESEASFRAVYEHGPVGVVLTDVEGTIAFANPALCRMLGYAESELRNKNYRELTADRELPAAEECAQRAAPAGGEWYQVEKRCRRKDGDLIWVAVSAAVVRGTDDRAPFVVSMVQDITERKTAEEALLRTESYLAESERLSHVGTWRLDVVAREIVFWSDEHYRIFGFDPQQGLPRLEVVLARVHPDDRHTLSAFSHAITLTKDYESEFRLLLPDGSVRHVLSIGHPALNAAGELQEFRGVAMDVTERRQVEQQLQAQASRLRALAAQLERVREEEGTRIARELHDELGSSLTGLKWGLEELAGELSRSKNVDSDALRARVARNAEMADSTIRMVKRIASELRPSVLDDLGLSDALEWQARDFQTRTSIDVTCDLGDIPPLGREQATAVFRIVQEALTNVLRHSGATHVHISTVADGSEFVLSIRDDGRGFPPDKMSGPEGLGILGMRERARLAGAMIYMDSAPGRGTTVALHIPNSPRTDR